MTTLFEFLQTFPTVSFALEEFYHPHLLFDDGLVPPQTSQETLLTYLVRAGQPAHVYEDVLLAKEVKVRAIGALHQEVTYETIRRPSGWIQAPDDEEISSLYDSGIRGAVYREGSHGIIDSPSPQRRNTWGWDFFQRRIERADSIAMPCYIVRTSENFFEYTNQCLKDLEVVPSWEAFPDWLASKSDLTEAQRRFLVANYHRGKTVHALYEEGILSHALMLAWHQYWFRKAELISKQRQFGRAGHR